MTGYRRSKMQPPLWLTQAAGWIVAGVFMLWVAFINMRASLLSTYTKRLTDVEASQKQDQAALQQFRVDFIAIREELADTKHRLQGALDENVKLTNMNTELTNMNTELTNTNTRLAGDNNTLRHEVAELQIVQDAIVAERNGMQGEIVSLRGKVDTMERTMKIQFPETQDIIG